VLAWGDADLAITSGEVVIGRSVDCDVVLHDVLVSRHHAKIIVRDDEVVVEDLLSANGVYVNDARVERTRRLHDGDRILVATRELSAFALKSTVRPVAANSSARPAVTSSSREQPVQQQVAAPLPAPPGPTERAVPFLILGKMVEKFIVQGRVSDAERVIHDHMMRVLEGARGGLIVPQEVCDAAGEQAMKLARASGRVRWVDYAIELHARSRRLMTDSVIESLAIALSVVPPCDAQLFRHYMEVLRGMSNVMTRPELERVNRLVTLRPPASPAR